MISDQNELRALAEMYSHLNYGVSDKLIPAAQFQALDGVDPYAGISPDPSLPVMAPQSIVNEFAALRSRFPGMSIFPKPRCLTTLSASNNQVIEFAAPSNAVAVKIMSQSDLLIGFGGRPFNVGSTEILDGFFFQAANFQMDWHDCLNMPTIQVMCITSGKFVSCLFLEKVRNVGTLGD